MMENNYSKACTELLEILKYIPKEDFDKIPKEDIDFFEESKDKSYEYIFDSTKNLKEQSIMPETNALILSLYEQYFLTEDKKENFYKRLNENEIAFDQEARNKYNPDDIFKNIKTQAPTQNKEENSEMIVIKETFIEKIINKIKSIFVK